MKYRLWECIVLAAALCAGPAAALTPEDYQIPYGGVSGFYEFPDSDRHASNGYGLQLLLGYPLSERSSLEASFFSLQRTRDVDSQLDYAQGLSFNYVYDFGLFGYGYSSWFPDFKPYLLAGPGVVRDDQRGRVDYNPALDAGAGILLPLKIGGWNWGWSLRAEARALIEYNSHPFPDTRVPVDVQLGLGLNIPLTFLFKTTHQAPPPADCGIAVVDPTTGRKDCPGGDADGDGVPDDKDRCPGTAPGTPVDEHGCPLESGRDEDGDGVLDSDDQCPHTPHGVQVDAKGCAIAQTTVINDVQFEVNSAVLTDKATQVLDGLVSALGGQTNEQLEIGGYTDNSGSAAHNLVLSQQRAESVRQYLIGKGVDPKRLTARGYGEDRPVAPNDTDSGRQTNRRVEFKIAVQ